MKNNILEFTGEYYTRQKRSKELNEELSVLLITEMENLGINTNDPQFMFDMAWVVKFMQVTLDNQYGIANDLGRLMKQITQQEEKAYN